MTNTDFEEWCKDHDGEYSDQEVDGSEFCVWDDQNWVEYGNIYFASGSDETTVLTNPQEAAWDWDVSAPMEEFEESDGGLVHEDDGVKFYDTEQTGAIIHTDPGSREDDHWEEMKQTEDAFADLDVEVGYRVVGSDSRDVRPMAGAQHIPFWVGGSPEDAPTLELQDGDWVTQDPS